jgi:hypothetical protein
MDGKRKSSFEDHLNIVSSAHGQEKTASVKKDGGDLLAKLAAELGLDKKADAPVAEGERSPAEATPAAANPAVVAATEGVATPQVIMAGGNPAEAAAGEVPAATGPFAADPIISAGDGKAQTAQTLNKTDEAVSAAARGAGGSGETGKLQSAAVAQNPPQGSEKNAELEAEKIGAIIARSFQASLEKTAQDQEYANALALLEANNMLDSYNIKDRPQMTKTASEGYLEKVAANQPLSREDIIGAAYELIDLEKQANDAEAQGRADAHAFVELMSKIAEGDAAEAKAEGESEEQEKKENKKEDKKEEKDDEEKEASMKIASLMKDPAVVGAVKILRSKNLL